jgi:hypothetical protein
MKISDFKFAEYYIRNVCKHHGCAFIDLPVEIAKDRSGFHDGKIIIRDHSKLGKTIFHIVATYVQYADMIAGKKIDMSPSDKTSFYNSVVAMMRSLTYPKNSTPIDDDFKSVPGRLNRAHNVWSLMRNIICPAYDKPLENVKIVYGKTAFVDGAKYLTKDSMPSTDDNDFPFVFCNFEIENEASRDAFLFYEVLRAHAMDPRGVIHDIFTKQELWSKFLSSARIAYSEVDSINDFLTTLSILADEMGSIDGRLLKKSSNNNNFKAAQFGFGNSTWWYLGLIEKLLEPARGSDWSAYETMKPFTDELWDKVEAEKKKRGMKELPMELLLRLQSEQFRQQPDLIIQGLLADNRVW